MTANEKTNLESLAKFHRIPCHVQKHGKSGFQMRFTGDAWHRKEANARAALLREVPQRKDDSLGLGA